MGRGLGSNLVQIAIRVVDCRRLLGRTSLWASAYWTWSQVLGLQAGSVGPWVWSLVGLAEPWATTSLVWAIVGLGPLVSRQVFVSSLQTGAGR